MQAVRFHGKGDLRYEQIPIPAVGKGQVKVETLIQTFNSRTDTYADQTILGRNLRDGYVSNYPHLHHLTHQSKTKTHEDSRHWHSSALLATTRPIISTGKG